MHEVPPALPDHACNPGGKVIISLARPGRDAQDWDALHDFLPWQPPGSVGCEHRDFETAQRREAARNLMDVHLGATPLRKVAWADHEYAEWSFQRLIPWIAERIAGGYITYHDPLVSQPSALVG
jgi:hypothetical protein